MVPLRSKRDKEIHRVKLTVVVASVLSLASISVGSEAQARSGHHHAGHHHHGYGRYGVHHHSDHHGFGWHYGHRQHHRSHWGYGDHHHWRRGYGEHRGRHHGYREHHAWHDGHGEGQGGGGFASWYGGRAFNGHKTASGERLNPGSFTAAHRFWPFGTRVLVTNSTNGRSIVVRINDRGPFAAGRVIDLSEASARAIGMSGLARVRLARL